ncbi:DeoR/GlpR family DNA-binding transcription regulator [Paenibacillus guangzhouensis]|uniref:DeoR/GlpR family DNA-binding transcription regulator n=1 Tax=Paenibacillus guangzhouensis TaxID=1473112 RepID=UPI001266EE80|nr:DeoR/GlpR family DNA-binding transcription regulator [Paenibacillus guangzhouensis]
MFVEERHQAILQKLQQEKSVRASDLIQIFQVSFETIRRDLEFLESEGVLRRVHGGAILTEMDYSREIPRTLRENTYLEEKNELAEIAASFVEEGQSIALDVSTTNNHFAQVLKRKFDRLTIITNSLPIAHDLMSKPNYTIILIGGVIRNSEQGTIGDLAQEFASRFHADLFFMSMSGVTLTEGITDYGIAEIQIKKIMHQNAKRTFALADSSKFDAVSLIKVCGATEVERFITDSHVSEEIVQKYKEHGIEITYQL